MAEAAMRLDRFLWWARLAPSRKVAQAMAEAGTLRIDGRRIDRAHAAVRRGAIIAFARHGRVRVLRVEALPRRRGPPAEAACLYQDLQTANANSVDALGARA
ncbi:S4 domain-containing protein [Stakelama saccharophila]|uniref:S4 domain-containing protein n=1 Tax=Stakelama saccharophila TaxID=3075605 RepID=A0ABZ0BAH4_9SPHN|nr:S4 domain-containing protein [Stakelama sp. W311]WNO54273.1 S4 domain-containing protein [Stakelama sp. W311]